jgi:hypothetical protein
MFSDHFKAVISNKMIFHENGKLIDFSEPLIHTFSKTAASIGEEWTKKLQLRENVILMGKQFKCSITYTV